MKKLTGKKLLKTAINQILAHPETWSQSVYHSSCGTRHCLAGWCQILSGKPVNRSSTMEDAVKALGISRLEALALFRESCTLSEMHAFATNFKSKGFNRDGFNREGYDRQGYNRDGYNCEGYSRDGYNCDDYNRDGFNRDGYSLDGYNYDGFNRQGYNCDGYNCDGFNRDGYDRDGYNCDGFNREGERLKTFKV